MGDEQAMAVAEITRAQIVADAQNGRVRLKVGNPVLCMEWVNEMVERYSDHIENMTERLTMFEEAPAGGMKNPLADTSIVIARLEVLLGELQGIARLQKRRRAFFMPFFIFFQIARCVTYRPDVSQQRDSAPYVHQKRRCCSARSLVKSLVAKPYAAKKPCE